MRPMALEYTTEPPYRPVSYQLIRGLGRGRGRGWKSRGGGGEGEEEPVKEEEQGRRRSRGGGGGSCGARLQCRLGLDPGLAGGVAPTS